MTTHPPIHIPPAIEQQAISTIDAMNARGMRYPHALTSQCRQIALVVCAKWNETDKKLLRALVNRMVCHVYDSEQINTHQCYKA